MSTESLNSGDVSPKKTKKKKLVKAIFIITGCLVLLFGAAWYYRFALGSYYYNYKVNNFKEGDRLYVREWMVNRKSRYGAYDLNLYRLIVPINKDSKLKPGLVETQWMISADSLFKYKTGYLGNYLDWHILDDKIDDYYIPLDFYAITTNKKMLVKDTNSSLYDLPAGYDWGDGPFYVKALDVSDHEITHFEQTRIIDKDLK